MLDIDSAGMKGSLPELSEGSFPALLALFSGNNDFDGPIPESWQNLNLFSEVCPWHRTVCHKCEKEAMHWNLFCF